MFETVVNLSETEKPLSRYKSSETGHGRKENRCTEIFAANVEVPKGWNGIATFARVHRFGTRHGEAYDHYSYYMLSQADITAEQAHIGIRNHWGIENCLHWTKDAIMREDYMRASNPKQATCVATLNTLALNLFQLAGITTTKLSFACYNNHVKELYNLFQLDVFG